MRVRTLGLGLVLVLAITLLGPVSPVAAATLTVTLTPSVATVVAGSDVTFTVTVASTGAPSSSAFVTLQRTGADGASASVDANLTDGAGTVTLTDRPLLNATYTATADTEGPAPDFLPESGTSAAVSVAVAFLVEPMASPVAVPPGGELTLTARTEPAAAGMALVEERAGTGPWRSLGERPVSADGSLRISLGRRSAVGTLTYRVTRLADALHAAGVAEATAQVTVTGGGKSTAWRPLAGSKTRPAHWGTCRIGYRLNPANMPPHGKADLAEAIRRLAQVSGIRFRELGATKRVPFAGDSRAGVNKVTIAWASARATRGLLGPGIGGVGGTSVSFGGRILTGYLVLNKAFSDAAPAGFGAGSSHGLVLMHELGHVVGLGHFASRTQVMHPSASLPASVWGAGDQAGLTRLGRAGGCR